MYDYLTQIQYYQSIKKGYEDSAAENKENITSFRDMLSVLYQPFFGLNTEKTRLLGSIRMPGSPNRGAVNKTRNMGDTSVLTNKSLYNPYEKSLGPSQLMKPELRDIDNIYVDPNSGRVNPQELSPFSTVKDYKRSRL